VGSSMIIVFQRCCWFKCTSERMWKSVNMWWRREGMKHGGLSFQTTSIFLYIIIKCPLQFLLSAKNYQLWSCTRLQLWALISHCMHTC